MLPDEIKLASDTVGEKNDCAVKAVAVVTGKDYTEIHSMFSKCGRKPHKGARRSITRDVLFQLGYCLENITPIIRTKTVRTLERDDPVVKPGECYLVFVKGHVSALKNGKVRDWTAGCLHRIVRVEKVVCNL